MFIKLTENGQPVDYTISFFRQMLVRSVRPRKNSPGTVIDFANGYIIQADESPEEVKRLLQEILPSTLDSER